MSDFSRNARQRKCSCLWVFLCVKLCDGSVYYECVKYISLYMVVCKVVSWFSLNFECVRYISLYRGVVKLCDGSVYYECVSYITLYIGVYVLSKRYFFWHWCLKAWLCYSDISALFADSDFTYSSRIRGEFIFMSFLSNSLLM